MWSQLKPAVASSDPLMRAGDVIALCVKIDAAAVLSACFSPWLTRGPADVFFFLPTLSLLSHPPLHAQPLLTSSSLSLSLSPLTASLYRNPTPHLSPSSPDQALGEEGFYLFIYLFSLRATSCGHIVPRLRGVTARLEVKIMARPLPLRPRNLQRVGGRGQTVACVSVWERKVTSVFPETLSLAYL